MADKKIFTNTYITNSGRHNYLRIDHLEDPLFTSFTFDIDYITSPLFYTIKDYTYPKELGLSEKIEIALKEMYGKNMGGKDEGYDILPTLSAFFLGGDKLGYGLQQNVYMDMPLYGATEYIYMVDKRNGDGSQNDVRYDSSKFVEGGGNPNAYNSYKIGDTVKGVVSESDREWERQKIEQLIAQSGDCEEIMKSCEEQHNKNKEAMETALKTCMDVKVTVEGVEGEKNEADLLKGIKEYKEFANDFEQFKRTIINWANGEIAGIQSKIMSHYNQNECVRKIMSYDDATEKKSELESRFGSYYKKDHIWDGEKSFLKKCLDDKNIFETRTHDVESYYKADDGKSFALETKGSDGKTTIRESKILEKYEKELGYFDLLNEDGTLKGKVCLRLDREAPDWAWNMPDVLGNFVDISIDAIKHAVLYTMQTDCNMDSFENFESDRIKENEKMLDNYESALENLRYDLYGMVNGETGDSSNYEDVSPYGIYMAAKEKYENDDYSQAEKLKEMSDMYISGDDLDYDGSDSDYDGSDYISSGGEQSESNNIATTMSTNNSEEQNKPLVTPQTVLDMLGFISGMRKMTTEYPYIMQSITGLDKAYETHYGIKDPYMGSGDNKIVISCLESIDLRVSSMFNRYFNAIYDRQYRRERVPINMRRFNCTVYVHDVRNFVSKYRKEYTNRILELTDMYYSVIEFRFYDCEIVSEETGNIFNSVSNESPSEMQKTNFTFTYGNCVVNFVPQSEVASR
jgi:hypothetical protein